MTINGLLPIGSVVLLKDSTKKTMITGVVQGRKLEDGTMKVYDYCGVVYPEGNVSPDKTLLFNGEQIDSVYFIGYQDNEGLNFKEKADAVLNNLKTELDKK